jgi:hypothetical protein
VKVVTEFVFAAQSSITIPGAQQGNLDALFAPADYLQSVIFYHTLCRDIEGKDRLKFQRAIARYDRVT